MGYPTETDSLHRQARTATGLGRANQPSAHSIRRATLINVKSSYGMMLIVNGIKLLMVLAFIFVIVDTAIAQMIKEHIATEPFKDGLMCQQGNQTTLSLLKSNQI